MSLAAACVFIGACATTVPAPQAGESSLIVGTLKGHVIGNGTNTDGADGMMNTERPYILGIAIRSETTGRMYQFHTERGDGLFLLANAEPGLYRVTATLPGFTKVMATPAGATVNSVTASGTGTTQAAPDTAEMSFGVTTTSANAKSALDDASTVAEQIASAVKKQGIAGEDIQTIDVSVYPQTVDRNGKQVITGYQASLSVQVKVRDIAKLGEVISAANAAGANTISGPTFTIADPTPLRAKALDEAVADARKSAEAMAQAAGKSVGEVLSVSSSDVSPVPGAMFGASDVAGAAKVPIETGQLDITANVVVVFELK